MRKRPIPNHNQEIQPDEEFVAEMLKIYRPMKEQMEAEGMPRPQIKAKIIDMMALALMEANSDLPPGLRAAISFAQAATVAAPTVARLFPDGYGRGR